MDALATILKLGSGHFIEDLNAELVKVADEVLATGKPGKVTVTLTVGRPQGVEPVVTIMEVIGATMPKRDAEGAFLFLVDGQFHARDPRQAEMEFREVKADTQTREGAAAQPTVREAKG